MAVSMRRGGHHEGGGGGFVAEMQDMAPPAHRQTSGQVNPVENMLMLLSVVFLYTVQVFSP